jgi:hypothetical protein
VYERLPSGARRALFPRYVGEVAGVHRWTVNADYPQRVVIDQVAQGNALRVVATEAASRRQPVRELLRWARSRFLG